MMNLEDAKKVVYDLEKNNSPMLSVLEAMAMVQVLSDDDTKVYAIHKGNVTFMAQIYHGDIPKYDRCSTQTISW